MRVKRVMADRVVDCMASLPFGLHLYVEREGAESTWREESFAQLPAWHFERRQVLRLRGFTASFRMTILRDGWSSGGGGLVLEESFGGGGHAFRGVEGEGFGAVAREVGGFENLADFGLGVDGTGEGGAAAGPADGLFEGGDLDHDEAGDEFLEFGEGTVDDGLLVLGGDDTG